MYIATIALCSCGGCHDSLMSVGEPLVELLNEHTISYSGRLIDRRSISPSDVVIATGGIRNSEETEIAEEVARTSRKVIAVGSCAVYGGIPGMSKIDLDDERDPAGLPAILEEVSPLDEKMTIELYVPGCPPPPNLVFEALKSTIEGYTPLHFEGTVCSECHRRSRVKRVKTWKEHPGDGVPDDECLLNHGLLCLGPVTRGGCHAVCPEKGSICIGCRGPSDMILSSQLHSLYTDMVKFLSLSTATRESRVEEKHARLLETLYLFTRRDPVTRGRVRERFR